MTWHKAHGSLPSLTSCHNILCPHWPSLGLCQQSGHWIPCSGWLGLRRKKRIKPTNVKKTPASWFWYCESTVLNTLSLHPVILTLPWGNAVIFIPFFEQRKIKQLRSCLHQDHTTGKMPSQGWNSGNNDWKEVLIFLMEFAVTQIVQLFFLASCEANDFSFLSF